MQGEMVMPGSMALDKDLGRVEQGTHQTQLYNPQQKSEFLLSKGAFYCLNDLNGIYYT